MAKKCQVIKVSYVPPPLEVRKAVKNANKPRVTIIYPGIKR